MAFNFFKWLLRKPEAQTQAGGESTAAVKVAAEGFLDEDLQSRVTGLEVYLCRMAFWAIVRKIGSAVAAVEWETYRRGKKVKAREYWAWNSEPNPNQSREAFFQSLVGQLYQSQEALIVETRGGARYVADAFSVTRSLSGDIYRDIIVRGESVPGVFCSDDVIHLEIDGERIRRVLTAIAAAEGQLMKSAATGFMRRQGVRGVLKIDDTAEAEEDFEETYSDLVNTKFRKYFTSDSAVLPMFSGYEYKENPPPSNPGDTRDMRHLMDDVVELTAQAFGSPVSIVTGKSVTAADFNTFMTFNVLPIVRMIAGEINRKVFGHDLVSAGTYVVANCAGVRYIDLFDVANPIDKLIGSGGFCVNDIRVRLGLDVIDEPWAWQHWMTKNYSSVEDLLVGVDSTDPAGQPEKKEDGNEQEAAGGAGE